MNDLPPSQEPSDPIDDAYRRASALDPSRPSPGVRRAVLDHATRLAAERVAAARAEIGRTTQRYNTTVGHKWWRPALFGTLAAAAAAGLLVAPQVFKSRSTATGGTAGEIVTEPVMIAPLTESAPTSMTTPGTSTPTPAPTPTMPSTRTMAAKSKSERAATAAPESAPASRPEPLTRSQARFAPARAATAAQQHPMPADAAPDTAGGLMQRRDSIAAAPATAPALANSATPSIAAPEAPIGSAAELRSAAAAGDMSRLRASLNAHVDINSRDNTGRTALLLATLHAQTDAVRELLAHGADPNVADNHGVTPLQAATSGGHAALIKALQQAGAQ